MSRCSEPPRLISAIDGPAGSGKSTVAKRVAGQLGFRYLDTGAMYRAVAIRALEESVPLTDEATLAALTATSMKVSPHIVIGLHYGRVLGEPVALDIVSLYPVEALVLVMVMPFYAGPGLFAVPDTADVGRIFGEARRRLHDRQVLLGCARPPGLHKRAVDAYAVMAGLDGIAFPADGVVGVARAIGRPFHQEHACCSIKLGAAPVAAPSRTCAA